MTGQEPRLQPFEQEFSYIGALSSWLHVHVDGEYVDAIYTFASDSWADGYAEEYDRVVGVKFMLRGLGISSLDGIEGLDTVPRIDELDVGDNAISSLQGLDEMPFAPTLKKLYAYNNELKDLKGLANLPNLHTLWLSGNNLSELSASDLASSTKLKEITIGKNDFKQFPDFSRFPGTLNVIGLSDNAIQELKLDFLPRNLKSLNLARNQIYHIPNLTNYPRIEFILEENPIKSVHPKVISSDFANIDGLSPTVKEKLRHQPSP